MGVPGCGGSTGPTTSSTSIIPTVASTSIATTTVPPTTIVTTSSISACTYALSIGPTIDGYPTGGTFSAGVTAPSGCSWTAVSSATWIHITAGNSGSGTGTVTFAADANPAPARTGTIVIAGQTITFNQSSALTTISSTTTSVSPTTSAHYGSGAGTNNSLDISLFFTVAPGGLAPSAVALVVRPLATYTVTGSLTANPNNVKGTIQGTLNGTPASGTFSGTISLQASSTCTAKRNYSGSVTTANLNWSVFSDVASCAGFNWPFGTVAASAQ